MKYINNYPLKTNTEHLVSEESHWELLHFNQSCTAKLQLQGTEEYFCCDYDKLINLFTCVESKQ